MGDNSEAVQKPEPRWLASLKNNWAVVVASVVLSLLVTGADAAKKIRDGLEAIGWTKSEAFELAESTAKSNFSDNLARAAWLRLYWADVYARRVEASAKPQDIDAAWTNYIEATAKWNADLMVNIVGVERYYGRPKSQKFEFDIQGSFQQVDTAMGKLRGAEGNVAGQERIGWPVHDRTASSRMLLYEFVRCFKQEKAGSTERPALDQC
jgi:hypothetical protein